MAVVKQLFLVQFFLLSFSFYAHDSQTEKGEFFGLERKQNCSVLYSGVEVVHRIVSLRLTVSRRSTRCIQMCNFCIQLLKLSFVQSTLSSSFHYMLPIINLKTFRILKLTYERNYSNEDN